MIEPHMHGDAVSKEDCHANRHIPVYLVYARFRYGMAWIGVRYSAILQSFLRAKSPASNLSSDDRPLRRVPVLRVL